MPAERLILDRTFERTLERVRQRLLAAPVTIKQAEIWLFEDAVARQQLAQELQAHGIAARVHCAYKPLVHHVLEAVERVGLTRLHLRYPVPAGCPAERFRIETYPLARLVGDAELTFEASPMMAGDGDVVLAPYELVLHYGARVQRQRVLAPNQLRRDFLGNRVCVPTAWLQYTPAAGGPPVALALDSEHQQCHAAVLQAMADHAWGAVEPYFQRLLVRVDLPGMEQTAGDDAEVFSTVEAMHEDLYFSLLDYFQRHSGRAMGSRGLQPGQIVPDVRLAGPGPARAQVFLRPAAAVPDQPVVATAPDATALPWSEVAQARRPLPLAQLAAAMAHFDGQHFVGRSVQGRPVPGVHVRGARPAVVISGAQHANETSGVVGALRAAHALQQEPGAHFVLVPLENPDGYALHETLCAQNPGHMQHAARYSALGDDIEWREQPPWLERHVRQHAFAVSGADLHLNLHGYPAHEWTRPWTGYLPRGFELWGLPKGFFLIGRHRPGHEQAVRELLHAVTRELGANDRLMRYNAAQLRVYQQHAGTLPFEIINGVACMTTSMDTMECDVTLVTEFPDETIYGDAFAFAHEVQMQTVLAAARWWWRRAGH